MLGNSQTFNYDCKHTMLLRRLLFNSFSNIEIKTYDRALEVTLSKIHSQYWIVKER